MTDKKPTPEIVNGAWLLFRKLKADFPDLKFSDYITPMYTVFDQGEAEGFTWKAVEDYWRTRLTGL